MMYAVLTTAVDTLLDYKMTLFSKQYIQLFKTNKWHFEKDNLILQYL